MIDNYTLTLSDLKSGAYTFTWGAGTEFFEAFENEQIRAAELEIRGRAQKTASSVLIDLEIDGFLTVPCDRCLEDVQMPVDTAVSLKVRFGQPSAEDADEEDGRELILIAPGEGELDLSQVIYDYACLSLPIQCRHREGGCNPEASKFLKPSKATSVTPDPADSPFAALKGLFDNK